jgi:hypothetical protein
VGAKNRTTALMALLLLSSCQLALSAWVPLYTNEDYDLVQYEPISNTIWASNNFSDDIISIDLNHDASAQYPVEKIALPGNLSLGKLCVSSDVWVVADFKLVRYLPLRGSWSQEPIINLDQISDCQVGYEKNVLFFGKKDKKAFVAIYDNIAQIHYIELLPETTDVQQDYWGETWLITSDNGLYKLDENFNWVRWGDISGERIFFAEPNMLWVAKNNSLYLLPLDDSDDLELLPDFEYDLTVSVYQGADSRIWLVTQSGIWEYTSEGLNKVAQPSTIKHINIVHGFDPDSNTLFVSTEDGIYAVSLEK